VTQYYAQQIQNTPVSRRQNTQAVRQALLIIMAGALLVAGFIYAIYQHAEAVKEGYKTQQLMLLREQLEREKHRLELQKAYYRSPQVIEPLARRMGLVRPDSSQVIITDANGEFKRWIPGLKREAIDQGVVHVSRRLEMTDVHAVMTDSPLPDASIDTERGERVSTPGTAPAVRTRPKRVEAEEASVPTRIPDADAEASANVDEAPKAWLEGVLTFPEGQAELKLEKTRKRKKR